MKRWTPRWMLALTAAAVLTLPVSSAAQSTPPQPPTPTQQAQPGDTQDQPNAEAQEHLRKARATLDEVKAASLDARARAQFNELKKRLTALERAAGANDKASTTGQANRSARATAARGNDTWGTEVAAIDKALTTLLGPASATGASNPTTAGTTGTSGTANQKRPATITLDEDTRTKLTEFRTHITAFATAMAGGTAAPSAAESTSATGTSGAPTSTAGTAGATGTSGSTTQPPQTTDPQQQTEPPASPQVDQEAARRHLTEARNALSAMTQLPAAAQLQGEARTQISQLITNFNELITTQAEWRASYAKVEANLTALIGPDPEAASQTAGTTGTGTTGTAGTSGATAGIADLDPAIRQQLVELRRHLTLFEKAAGGAAGADQAAGSAGTTAGTTGAPATGTPTTGTAGTSGTMSPEPQTGATQATQADLAKHLAAIDQLLQNTDESGGLTLTKAQVEQLRTHWAALRQILNERR